MSDISGVIEQITRKFEHQSGITGIQTEFRERGGNSVLLLHVANPSERLFKILEQVREDAAKDNPDAPLATLLKKSGDNVLLGPEGRLFIRTLAESLNINRHSFGSDFLARYTKSVAGAEEQVAASANHIVYGRRGAGKSTLLLYALHSRERLGRSSVWVDMQVYARRDDDGVIADLLCDLLTQMSAVVGDQAEYSRLQMILKGQHVTEEVIRKNLPAVRRLLSHFASEGRELFIFLDDFHVLGENLQPKLLDVLYAVCRGNKVFLKLSAIETLTHTFHSLTKQGLEIPHDAQLIRLDYNLTIPDKANQHIETILDSHAIYCGLPSVRRLCVSADVIPRLTWVAAGVPRDALSLFSEAMTKAARQSRRRISVSNVNVAASEAINSKLDEVKTDVSPDSRRLSLEDLLESIRDFCIKKHRRNAFLIEIKSNTDTFEQIRQLVDLRLLHVINEGITIREAGRKYLGLMLDYGFYIGFRAARSVDLFNQQYNRVAYKELRKLPVFS